jgi:hypothetical protein
MLDTQALLAGARSASGLDDYGEMGFAEGLEFI